MKNALAQLEVKPQEIELNQSNLEEDKLIDLNTLKPTEFRVLQAMLVSNSDREAWELAQITKGRFYQLKPKLSVYKEELKNNLTNKAWDSLFGYVTKAVHVLGRQLDHHNAKIAQTSAKDIIDRVLGEPTKKIEETSKKEITILGISATVEQLDKLKQPIVAKIVPTSDDLTAPINKTILEAEEV